MRNRCDKSSNLYWKQFCALFLCILLIPCAIFSFRFLLRTRFQQKQEKISYTELKKNIEWRGFQLPEGKNPAAVRFTQIDPVYCFSTKYTIEEFHRFLQSSRMEESSFRDIFQEYRHLLKQYHLPDSAFSFPEGSLSAAKRELPSVSIFLFWNQDGGECRVQMIFFTI